MSFGEMGQDEDVHMTEEVELGQTDELAVDQHVVVDTNILIHDFDLVKALFRILSLPAIGSKVHLLIPSIVIHGQYDLYLFHLYMLQLDNIQKSDRVEIRDCARGAMRFLLHHVKLRREDPRVPLRVQKQAEVLRLDLTLGKPDDKVLDCCLRFQPGCRNVWLWTKDLNLSLKAEGNDVPALNWTSLKAIVTCLGLDPHHSVRKGVEDWMRGERAAEVDAEALSAESEAGGMEFDIDIGQDLPSFLMDLPTASVAGVQDLAETPCTRSRSSGTLLDDYLAHYSPSDMPVSPPMPVLTPVSDSSPPTPSFGDGVSTPSRLSMYDQHDRLLQAVQPLLQHLSVDPPTTDRYLTALLDKLLSIEKAVDNGIREARQPPTDEQRALLVGISSTRTLVRYFERKLQSRERRPRTGEVADCIVTLAEMTTALGLDQASCLDLQIVAEQIRTQ